MSSSVRLRALIGFFRAGALVKPGEVFRAELAEAFELVTWQRCEFADAADSARYVRVDARPDWTMPIQTRGE